MNTNMRKWAAWFCISEGHLVHRRVCGARNRDSGSAGLGITHLDQLHAGQHRHLSESHSREVCRIGRRGELLRGFELGLGLRGAHSEHRRVRTGWRQDPGHPL